MRLSLTGKLKPGVNRRPLRRSLSSPEYWKQIQSASATSRYRRALRDAMTASVRPALLALSGALFLVLVNRLCQCGQLATCPSSGAPPGIGNSGGAGSGTQSDFAPVDGGRRGSGHCGGIDRSGVRHASTAGSAETPAEFHSPRRRDPASRAGLRHVGSFRGNGDDSFLAGPSFSSNPHPS